MATIHGKQTDIRKLFFAGLITARWVLRISIGVCALFLLATLLGLVYQEQFNNEQGWNAKILMGYGWLYFVFFCVLPAMLLLLLIIILKRYKIQVVARSVKPEIKLMLVNLLLIGIITALLIGLPLVE